MEVLDLVATFFLESFSLSARNFKFIESLHNMSVPHGFQEFTVELTDKLTEELTDALSEGSTDIGATLKDLVLEGMDSDSKGSHGVFSDGTYGSAIALDPAATDPDVRASTAASATGLTIPPLRTATAAPSATWFDSRWHPSLRWRCWTCGRDLLDSFNLVLEVAAGADIASHFAAASIEIRGRF